MRKHCRRRHHPSAAPMLAFRDAGTELRERMLIEDLRSGRADTGTYDNLADMRNILTVAAAHKDNASTLAICEAMRDVFANMRDRCRRTGRIGCTGDELAMVMVFIDEYADFWKRQNSALYLSAMDGCERAMNRVAA